MNEHKVSEVLGVRFDELELATVGSCLQVFKQLAEDRICRRSMYSAIYNFALWNSLNMKPLSLSGGR